MLASSEAATSSKNSRITSCAISVATVVTKLWASLDVSATVVITTSIWAVWL